jgi:LysM repeat protein
MPKDSVGLAKVKGKIVIVHKVNKGEGLLAIARKYNTTVDEIKALNKGLKTPGVGQKIKVPYNKPTKVETAAIDSTKVTVDESHANADSKEITYERKHIVAQGETLVKIAAKYKVTTQQLVKWNSLKNNNVTGGQELIVSGATATKSYEKLNQQNSTSSKIDTPKNILSPSTTLIEETGFAIVFEKITHPTLPIGTFIVCVNPETQKQVLVQVEQNTQLKENIIIGINQATLNSLGLSAENATITINYHQP